MQDAGALAKRLLNRIAASKSRLADVGFQSGGQKSTAEVEARGYKGFSRGFGHSDVPEIRNEGSSVRSHVVLLPSALWEFELTSDARTSGQLPPLDPPLWLSQNTDALFLPQGKDRPMICEVLQNISYSDFNFVRCEAIEW